MKTQSSSDKPLTKAAVIWTIIGCLILAGGIPGFIKFQKHRREINAITAEQAYQAARTGNVARLKWILDRRPDLINQPGNSYGSTALHAAVWFSQPLAVKELLRQKADVNAPNDYGITPLHDCAQKGTAEIALILLDHGADVTLRNRAGKTPLQVAIDYNHPDIAEVLRQHGAKE